MSNVTAFDDGASNARAKGMQPGGTQAASAQMPGARAAGVQDSGLFIIEGVGVVGGVRRVVAG